jgi:hypothetical protein
MNVQATTTIATPDLATIRAASRPHGVPATTP